MSYMCPQHTHTHTQSHLDVFYESQSRLNSVSVIDDHGRFPTRRVCSAEDINISAGTSKPTTSWAAGLLGYLIRYVRYSRLYATVQFRRHRYLNQDARGFYNFDSSYFFRNFKAIRKFVTSPTPQEKKYIFCCISFCLCHFSVAFKGTFTKLHHTISMRTNKSL